VISRDDVEEELRYIKIEESKQECTEEKFPANRGRLYSNESIVS